MACSGHDEGETNDMGIDYCSKHLMDIVIMMGMVSDGVYGRYP